MVFYVVSCDERIYASKEDIKKSYKGVGIRGMVVIKELEVALEPHFTKAWETGGYISENDWKEIPVE
jgi:hypothetical protein